MRAARLSTPGHIIETEKPQRAHPVKHKAGYGEKAQRQKLTMHKTEQTKSTIFMSTLSPIKAKRILAIPIEKANIHGPRMSDICFEKPSSVSAKKEAH